MKRTFSPLVYETSVASLSQANVANGSSACTPIAVMACANYLFPPLQKQLELNIHQGAALYAVWRESHSGGHIYAHAKEIIDLVSPALPICAGDEDGGVSVDDLPQMLSKVPAHAKGTAVLTCGAISIALLNGGLELFDSHSHPAHNNCAISIRFSSRDELISYLQQEYAQMTEFSLCVVKKRLFCPPELFHSQEPAFSKANRLPRGFFHIWGRDWKENSGSKQYLVGGFEDFFHYYCLQEPKFRHHYDMARADWPVRFYMDLEFESLAQNRGKDPRKMLRLLLGFVQDQYEAEEGSNISLTVFDSSDMIIDKSIESENDMSISDDDDDDNGQHLLTKASYHVVGSAWFPSVDAVGLFVDRVFERAFANGAHSLKVWREKRGAIIEEHFADVGVYTRNRFFRLPWSCKLGSQRRLLPLDNGACVEPTRDGFFSSILSPLMVELYAQQPEKRYVPTTASSAVIPRATYRSSSTMLALSNVPISVQRLGKAIEAHYKPEEMRGCRVDKAGLITFSMVKHDCEICQTVHGNQCYAVADLKLREWYQKCHVDRSAEGTRVLFPDELGPLSMIDEEEMDEHGVFPAESGTARMVLGFSGAIFSVRARTVPHIPRAGEAEVVYKMDKKDDFIYEAELPTQCPRDGGLLFLEVSLRSVTIRCNGKHCTGQGGRWTRPSHSGVDFGKWHMSFLFPTTPPPPLPSTSSLVLSVEGNSFPVTSQEEFLSAPNLLIALGFCTLDAPHHQNECNASLALINHSLQTIRWWCKNTKMDQTVRSLLDNKVNIMSKVFKDDTMMTIYHECLQVAPEFAYPMNIVPQGPVSLVMALWMHLARKKGYKRVEDKFYVPISDESGRRFYHAIPIGNVLTSIFTYSLTPNICTHVLWNPRTSEMLRRMLNDENHFPSMPISKRYIGYANAVYDLEENVALTWDQVEVDASVMPFNFLDQQFPLDTLEEAKANCPNVHLVNNNTEVRFDGALHFVRTALFDGPLHDQQFTDDIIFWLYALLGRLFHYVGKGDGDNWETMLFIIGAPGSFKSSLVDIVQRYYQKDQIGVIGSRVEPQFPLDDVLGKMIGIMTECGGCTLDRTDLKLIGAGDPVKVNRKNKTAINVSYWATPLLFAGNSYLKVSDTDGALFRRTALFPFLRMLRAGQGATDLADRIFQEEGPKLIIKWNTMYLKIRSCIKQRIQPLLPKALRDVTEAVMMESDSFKSFFTTELIVTGNNDNDTISWANVEIAYSKWCRVKRKEHQVLDIATMEAQTMLRLLGVNTSEHHSATTLTGVRRRTLEDPPVRNFLKVDWIDRSPQPQEALPETSPAHLLLLGCICSDGLCIRNCRIATEDFIVPEEEMRMEFFDCTTMDARARLDECWPDTHSILGVEAWSDGVIRFWVLKK